MGEWFDYEDGYETVEKTKEEGEEMDETRQNFIDIFGAEPEDLLGSDWESQIRDYGV